MRILFGSSSHISIVGEAGGVRTQVLKTKESLEKLGHEVSLFDQWAKSPLGNYDILHLFMADLSTYHLALMAREYNIKLVVSPIIDRVIPHYLIRSTNFVIRKLPKLYSNLSAGATICDFADMVLARSSDERDRVEKSFGIAPSKIAIVPNGVAPEYLDAAPSLFVQKYNLKDFILTVGLIGEHRKNYLRLIKVVGDLGVPAVFVGAVRNTPYAKKCLDEVRKYRNIRILRFLEKPVLVSAYAAADTFVLPSTVEGTGLVALEAGLAGTKVVITRNGAPPYYFDKFAEYVNPFSEKSIKAKITKTLQKPKDTALREHIKSNFLWDIVGQKLSAAYDSIL